MVTTLIKNAICQSNFDKLGRSPNAKTHYRNLKSHRTKDQRNVTNPGCNRNCNTHNDVDKLLDRFNHNKLALKNSKSETSVFR